MSSEQTVQETESKGLLIRVKQAAEMLGVSPRTIWRMIADGQLRAVYVRGCTRLLAAQVTEQGSKQ
jgi:excisionase family DNA binding protein